MFLKLSILGFAGSLRQNSYNRALLRAAQEMVPSEARLEIFDLAGIPPFNQDMEHQPAEKVKDFKAAIRAADALLIVTPEYNYSMPGVLKNALDSASDLMVTMRWMGNPLRLWVLPWACLVLREPSTTCAKAVSFLICIL